jgi:hypothetical protein
MQERLEAHCGGGYFLGKVGAEFVLANRQRQLPQVFNASLDCRKHLEKLGVVRRYANGASNALCCGSVTFGVEERASESGKFPRGIRQSYVL